MKIDGRYAAVTPEWLCIHKRWISGSRENPGARDPGHTAKPFTIKNEAGELLSFNSQGEFAEKIGVQPGLVTCFIRRMKNHPKKKAKISGALYYLIAYNEEEADYI